MKNVTRIIGGVLLACVLCVFCMWNLSILSCDDVFGALNGIGDVLNGSQNRPDQDGESDPPIEQPPGNETPDPGNENPENKDPDNETPDPGKDENQGGSDFDEDNTVVDINTSLYALLYSAALERRETVNVEQFGYTATTLKEEMTRFFFSSPELFYVDNAYTIYKKTGSEIVSQVGLRYLYQASEIPLMMQEYEQAVAQIVSGVPAGASDFDKILYLHDYLVQNYAYDYEGLATETETKNPVAIRDAYTFFKEKRGVCQAYMLALIALCDEVGIPCLPVTSDELNHAWNLVQLDGEWYHIDVTWDDAGGESEAVYPSYVSYRYFLLSGEALYESGRTAQWFSSERADSALYDDASWRDANTRMVKVGEYYYCVLFDKTVKETRIFRGNAAELTVVADFYDVRWYSGPKTYYLAAFSGSAVWEGNILLNSNNALYWYDPQENGFTLIADLSDTLGGLQIFGICDISDTGTVTYVAAEIYRGEYELREFDLPVG